MLNLRSSIELDIYSNEKKEQRNLQLHIMSQVQTEKR